MYTNDYVLFFCIWATFSILNTLNFMYLKMSTSIWMFTNVLNIRENRRFSRISSWGLRKSTEMKMIVVCGEYAG